MFVIGVNGTILSPNAGVEQLLGFSEKDLPGQHASVIFTPSDKAVEPPTGTDRIYLVICGNTLQSALTTSSTTLRFVECIRAGISVTIIGRSLENGVDLEADRTLTCGG